jgi:hypothetical protein
MFLVRTAFSWLLDPHPEGGNSLSDIFLDKNFQYSNNVQHKILSTRYLLTKLANDSLESDPHSPQKLDLEPHVGTGTGNEFGRNTFSVVI